MTKQATRQVGLIVAVTAYLVACGSGSETATPNALPVSAAPPTSLTCTVTNYGAKGDGATLNTQAIQSAIDACAAGKNGGTVMLPVDHYGGTFLSGMVTLKSNVTLFIASGAKLLGSQVDKDYPFVTPAPGNTQRALIYALDADNVKITGGGTIDGNGASNPSWNGTAEVQPQNLRPMLLLLARSSNITLDTITIQNSAMWTVVFLEDQYVHVNHLIEDSADNAGGRNLDGIDIVDSSNVIIENSTITSQDDSITLKSQIPDGAPYAGVSNVTVQNVTISSTGANGLKIGTATVGAFKNIVFNGVIITKVRYCAMEVESVDGGAVSDVQFENITVTQTGSLVYIMLAARGARLPGAISAIRFNTITASQMSEAWGNSISGTVINGVTYSPKDITFDNLQLALLGGVGSAPPSPEEYPYHTYYYPDVWEWKTLPAYAFYIRHTQNISFGSNVITTVTPEDVRPAFVASPDVTGSGF